ncbi:MAG: hypothetical protein ABIH26_01310 [Candidatus Eisenbacteria bacterium]
MNRTLVLEAALQEVRRRVEHQIGRARKLRNVADRVGKNDKKKVPAGARRICPVPDRTKALLAFRRRKER